jgi:tetratricopeptide (TPR) repeat protein
MQIGNYQILEELGRGGMGVVYRGMAPTGVEVAIKVLLNVTQERMRKRFRREAEALQRVAHLDVVKIHEHGVSDRGQPYLVMEYVAGETLQDRIRREGMLQPARAAQLTRRLCHAVAACHRGGVVHRDIKPENVLLTAQGGPKLTDFGLVRELDPSPERSQLSREGHSLGSPYYWAPEQAAGELAKVDERTDVYGLGATLYALLTGRPPHQGKSVAELMMAASRPKPPPSRLNPAVPPWLDAVVAKALASDPEQRFGTPEAFASALPAHAFGAERRPLPLAALVALGVVGVGAAVALSIVGWSGTGLNRAPPGLTEIASPLPPASPLAASPTPAPPAPAETTSAPTFHDVYAEALSLLEEARWEEAIGALDRALVIDPSFAQAYRKRGLARRRLGDLTGAVEDYSEAIRRDPRDPQAYSLRGVVLRKLGDVQAALSDYDEAIRLRPSYAEAHRNRAYARVLLRDLDGAMEDYDAAIRLDPSQAESFLQRGLSRMNEFRDLRGALSDLTEVIRLDPQSAAAYRNRAPIHHELGNLEQALSDSDAAIRLRPSARAFRNRGRIKVDLEDFFGAYDDFTESIRLGPQDGAGYLERGRVAESLGEPARAIQDLSRALELTPNAPWAAAARQELEQLRRRQGLSPH